VDTEQGRVSGRLLTVFDRSILSVTAVQHHWAGRGSRGVTQLSGRFHDALDEAYRPSIDESAARRFLQGLLDL
jgi:hypothetical protein